MIHRKIPCLVLTRMWSKCAISKQEFGAWKTLLNRSGINLMARRNTNDFHRILSSNLNSSRFFSTSKQRFEDGSDKNDKKGGPPIDPKHVIGIVALAMILTYLTTPNNPNNNGRSGVLELTYNDFYYNVLQAGEVAEIIIYPGENRENSVIILLRQGAMYKVSLFKYQK